MPRQRPRIEYLPLNLNCCGNSWFPWEGSYVCVHCGQAAVTPAHPVTKGHLAQAS